MEREIGQSLRQMGDDFYCERLESRDEFAVTYHRLGERVAKTAQMLLRVGLYGLLMFVGNSMCLWYKASKRY